MTSYRIELPEVFTGEDGKDFHQWIRRFEVAAEAFSDSSTKLHSLLPARLAGSAFTVWESLTESEKKDFKKVKEKLSQVFGRTQLIDTFKSCITARTRRPGEPLEVFAAAIASMVEEAFPNYDGPAKAGEKFRRYIAGLDKNLQVKIHEMGGSNFEEALKIALRVERAGQTHQDMGIQVATMNTTKDTTTQPSEMQLVLHRLNELEQKFEKMCSKLEASATSNVHPRPSTRSPQRYNSPEPRSDDRYQRRNRSPSPTHRAYQSTDANYRHRSPSPHIRDYPPRSPDHRRQYRSPSPQYSRHRSPSPRWNNQGHVFEPRPPNYQASTRTSPHRKPYQSGDNGASRQDQPSYPPRAGYQADPRRHTPYRHVRFEDQHPENSW